MGHSIELIFELYYIVHEPHFTLLYHVIHGAIVVSIVPARGME